LTQYFWWMGNPDQAIESGHRALAIAKDLGDFVLHVIATFGLGVVHHSLGDYRRAIDVLETTMDSLTGDLRHERFGLPGPPSVFFRVWLVQCLAELGEFARAIALGEEARAIAEAVERPFSRIQAHYGLGFVYLRKRALDRAIPIFERSLGLCETWNIPIWFPRIASALGYAYALSGRTTEALPLLEQAVERATSQRILFGYSLAAAWLSEAYLLAGRVDDATAHAEHALALPREHGERGYEAWAWRLLAEIASRRDPPDVAEAESRYGRSLALAEQLGMRPLLAHCHQGLGALHRRAGRAGEADDHFATAARLFRELDMPLR
jgi:tetratricopeptide (TPR) repeat protein